MGDEWQTYLKEKIMNNIERYFYLIVFAMYIREVGPKDYNQTFKQWMDEHASLREMIAEGRSKIEWERKIPDEKLMDLKTQLDCAEFKCGSLASTPDFFDVIGQVSWYDEAENK